MVVCDSVMLFAIDFYDEPEREGAADVTLYGFRLALALMTLRGDASLVEDGRLYHGSERRCAH